MKIKHGLDDLLGTRSRVALLRLLVAGRVESTGRSLARLAGIDHKTCLRSLADLAREGIVHRRGVGRAKLFTLNLDSPLFQNVLVPLFEWERGLADRLSADIRDTLGRGALSVYLFGSVTRGDETSESDIDVLAVARTASSALALRDSGVDCMDRIRRNYGRVLHPTFMTLKEFRANHKKKQPFLMEILRSGRHLDGLRAEELLDHGRTTHHRSKGPAR